ncbi:MAG TPA: PEP-CTERM sorting domain-containing protein, partial [Myxococcales bacterium]|nr:PEP-CTERM sorting domain-containing protein [Myxococcales bacterium]
GDAVQILRSKKVAGAAFAAVVFVCAGAALAKGPHSPPPHRTAPEPLTLAGIATGAAVLCGFRWAKRK